MTLGIVGTMAVTLLVLYLGYGIRAVVKPLDRLNIPAPVIGGLLIAAVLTMLRARGSSVVQFDTTLQQPLMIAFFTSLGFAASYRLLRAGGVQVIVLLAAASVLAVVQNLVGAGIALLYGLHPLFGVLTGAVSLTGGPATSLAFAPLIEQAGVPNASAVALASAMGGIVLGSLFGAPIATWLIKRHRLKPDGRAAEPIPAPAAASAGEPAPDASATALKCLAAMLGAMALGAWLGEHIQRAGITMPSYIGAMLVAGALRNLDDATGWLRLPVRALDTFGSVALMLFLVMALMNLDLLALTHLAQPLLVTLLVQLLVVALFCAWPLHRLMGRDYDSAVMCGGFAGFMLGTTANAMAVMSSLVERYGLAPRAFLVAPLVGAFFLDFTNALVITISVNLLR